MRNSRSRISVRLIMSVRHVGIVPPAYTNVLTIKFIGILTISSTEAYSYSNSTISLTTLVHLAFTIIRFSKYMMQ